MNTTRRRFVFTTSILTAGAAFGAGAREKFDVCIYGGTSGGVIAAVALARLGRSVAIIEPTRHLGGMTSGGLGWVDIKHGGIKAFGGLTGDYYARIRRHYEKESVDLNALGNSGVVAEPHIAEKFLEEMVAEQKSKIRVYKEMRLSGSKMVGRRLRTIECDRAPVDSRGAPAAKPQERYVLTIEAGIFIDCSYEGDLLATIGVTCRTDREGAAEYGESAAGIRPQATSEMGHTIQSIDPYVKPGDSASGLLPFVSDAPMGKAGDRSPIVQAFNFRLCLVKENKRPIAPPADYSAARYEVLARQLAAWEAAGQPIKPEEFHKSKWRLLKFSPLPHGRTDVNNAGAISMDFVGGNAHLYASANWAERQRMWHAHEDYQRGMLHFLATDERVPEPVRAELAKWGLPQEEFGDTGGWPTQLYVREARRMVGDFVMKQSDCEKPPASVPDSIGLGSYSLDSHVCQRLVQGGCVVHEGGFLLPIKGTYQIPYGAILPKESECENLLATFCVSSTHVCFASIRMEPPFMVMSESAAFAAHLALEGKGIVQTIDRQALATKLREAGQVLMPV